MQYIFVNGIIGIVFNYERPQQDYSAWEGKTRNTNGQFIDDEIFSLYLTPMS